MMRSAMATIRPTTGEDEPILTDMLHLALYVPPDEPPLTREALQIPVIARYVRGWGRPGDLGVIAEASEDGTVMGAAWMRLFTEAEPGFGFVGPTTPELAIAVAPDHRGMGLGGTLLDRLEKLARPRYGALSLSVTKTNPAVRLYRRAGFVAVEAHGDSLTMMKRLGEGRD